MDGRPHACRARPVGRSSSTRGSAARSATVVGSQRQCAADLRQYVGWRLPRTTRVDTADTQLTRIAGQNPVQAASTTARASVEHPHPVLAHADRVGSSRDLPTTSGWHRRVGPVGERGPWLRTLTSRSRFQSGGPPGDASSGLSEGVHRKVRSLIAERLSRSIACRSEAQTVDWGEPATTGSRDTGALRRGWLPIPRE